MFNTLVNLFENCNTGRGGRKVMGKNNHIFIEVKTSVINNKNNLIANYKKQILKECAKS